MEAFTVFFDIEYFNSFWLPDRWIVDVSVKIALPFRGYPNLYESDEHTKNTFTEVTHIVISTGTTFVAVVDTIACHRIWLASAVAKEQLCQYCTLHLGAAVTSVLVDMGVMLPVAICLFHGG